MGRTRRRPTLCKGGVRTHVFRGKRYRISYVPNPGKNREGTCDPPHRRGKQLRFKPNLKGLPQLELYVHEALHALYWDLDEPAISDAAYDLARFLWRLGFRLQTCPASRKRSSSHLSASDLARLSRVA